MTLWASFAAADVDIDGVKGGVEGVLRGFLSIDDLPCDSPRWWVRRRFRQAPGEIRQGLETLGFYRGQVQSDLQWQEACWFARFAVDAGPQARVRMLDLEVDDPLSSEPRLREARENEDFGPGEVFSHQAYESLKDRLLDVAQDLGYFDADFSRHVVTVDPESNSADIDLALAGGIRYRVGEVISEQTLLDAELFGHFLQIEEGAYYDAQDLTASYKNLLESDYFSRVLINPQLDLREDGMVPVRVIVTPAPRRTIQLGGGYATDTGPRVRGDLRYRRLNERGHRAGASALVSRLTKEIKAQYRLPYGDPRHEWLFAQTSYVDEQTDTAESKAYSVGVGRTHRFRDRWIETNYVDYTLEDFSIGEQQKGRSNLLILGTSFSRTSPIDVPRLLKGYSVSLEVRGATQKLISDTDFVQFMGRGRTILPLGSRVRLLSRVNVGWTWQNKFEDLPPSVRFFAGGDNSVRGYGYQDLGPEANGEVVGGRKLLTGSMELDTLLKENWSLAVFVDSGSAFDDEPTFNTGVGLGVRWYSPVGPVRLDLAHPLDDPDRRFRLHISLGTDL